jgi:hypothetical protein
VIPVFAGFILKPVTEALLVAVAFWIEIPVAAALIVAAAVL